jgi:hypothetical protein
MDKTELSWNDYKLSVDLHHSYLELAIKLNLFYYAITGAILSFYFTHPQTPYAKFALGLPILLSIGLSILFFWSAKLASNLRNHIRNTASSLGLTGYPEGIVLVIVCAVFGTVLSIVSIALLLFLACARP